MSSDEVFGAECLEQDRATRLFLYRGDMDLEWRAYGQGTEDAAKSFVAGINSYVDACLDGREAMPEEFRVLGYATAKWAPENVARIRSHGLYHDVEQEVARTRMIARHGQDVEDLRRRREPERAVRMPGRAGSVRRPGGRPEGLPARDLAADCARR